MSALPGRLGRLRARDVMTRQVVTLRGDDTLRQAALILRAARISGAPVVNEIGRPVGILSATDIVTYQHEGGAVAPESKGSAQEARQRVERDNGADAEETGEDAASDGSDWELLEATGFRVEQVPEVRVEEYMSPSVVSVTEDATLVDVARTMCQNHLHRLLVVNTEGRLRGIISTMDVLAALVSTVDEAEAGA